MTASSLRERLGVETPVVQAGMGGGVAGARLAASVSEAGGLGTIGFLEPEALADALAAARKRTARPLAVNLLLPFARGAHFRVAEAANAVVTFWGDPRRRTTGIWLHQCGSVEEVVAAERAGADGAIVQGREAGGHVRGTGPAHDLLERARAAVGDGFPLWLAGGICEAADVRAALEAGADAAVAGTRFLATDESAAHPIYKERVVHERETVLTTLFAAGWPAQHRVLRNEAVRRWTDADGAPPGWLRTFDAVTAPLFARAPGAVQRVVASSQRAWSPVLGPLPPLEGGPESLLEAGPLYAGETVARVRDVRPAAEVVAALVP